MFRKHLAAVAVLSTSLCAFGSAAAGIVTGDLVGATFVGVTDSPHQIFDYGAKVVTAGDEFTLADTSFFTVDISDTGLTLHFVYGANYGSLPFFGYEFKDYTSAFGGNHYQLDTAATTVPGFTASDVQLAGNLLTLNMAGLTVNGGETIVLRTVPEPETYALMLGGLGLVGWLARRPRRHSARA